MGPNDLLASCPFLKNKHVLLALSGGTDSIALFHLLRMLSEENLLRLTCAHFEHGIREKTSKEDMEFVIALCRKYNIPLLTECADVPSEAKQHSEGLETCARRMRYQFLNGARISSGADFIALAHHKDDQAETVLMHLLRGGGLSGACGMKKQEGVFVRPLLDIHKKALTDWLQNEGFSWREDETNLLPDNPRNLLRLQALPVLMEAYPGASDALYRFSEIAKAENAYMEKEVKKFLQSGVSFYAGVCILKLCPEPDEAILRRALHKLFPAFSFEEIERARNAESAVCLKSGVKAEKTDGRLYLFEDKEDVQTSVNGEGEYLLPGICRMYAEACEPEIIKNNPYMQTVAPSAIKNTTLRTRRAEDFICPLGMKGKRKLLSDYLTDKKIPRPIKDRLPVLARGSEILWAAGAGLSENIKIENHTGAVRLKIEINTEYGGNTHEK